MAPLAASTSLVSAAEPAAAANGSLAPTADVTTPIVISLGKQKRKRLRQLKRGRGKLMDEVMDVVEQVQANLRGTGADGKVVVPVVMVYRQKRRRGVWGMR